MSDQEAAKDAATQQRIINHMNKDHHDSIIRYLEHHHNLSPWTARHTFMTALDLNGMTFAPATSNGQNTKTYHIPFTPPLESYASARSRVVAMDAASSTALQRSSITVKTFPPPSARLTAALAICATTFVCFSQRWWFAPSSPFAALLGANISSFLWWLQPWVFWGMVGIHSAELAWFVPARLRKHSVDVGSGVFWAWCAAEFVAGVFCLWDFDALVMKEREVKEKARH
ncbi:hypothetical protein Q7P37_004601 [Cladosporium fusiforme]